MPSKTFFPSSVRGFARTSFFVAWTVALGACSLIDLDGLAGDPTSPYAGDDSGTNVNPHPTPNDDAGGDLDSTTPGTPDSDDPYGFDSGPDAEPPSPTRYAPPVGEYQYVQNTDAYTTKEFPNADPSKLGFEYMDVGGSCGSIAKATRSQANPMPATVTRSSETSDEVCWTFHLDIHPNDGNGGHQEDVSFCARENGLYARETDTTVQDQIWYLNIVGKQTAKATTLCSRTSAFLVQDMNPGDSWSQDCTGSTSATTGTYQSKGPYTYVGPAALTIEGVGETAFHVKQVRSVSGVMNGTETTEFYMSMRDGMPLRIHRTTHIKTPTKFPCIDTATYDNFGSDWLLKSRTFKPLPGSQDAGSDAAALR